MPPGNAGSESGTSPADRDMVLEEKKEHINILELRAIYYALKNMEEIVKGKDRSSCGQHDSTVRYQKARGDEVPSAERDR